MKTGQVFELATYKPTDRYPLELVRVPKIGSSISNADLTFAGSICLFLKIDGVNYALTCQHCVTSSEEKFIPGKENGVILQPSKEDLEDDVNTLNELMAKPQAFLQKYDADKLKFKRDGGVPPEATDEQIKVFKGQLDGYQERKTAMETAMVEVSLPFGTLMHAPGIAPHHTTNFRRDWALIKLNEERFQSLPPNVVSYSS